MIQSEDIWVLAVVGLAYLVGSIPTGYWVVKHLTGQDLLKEGSGSTGATNVRRVAGTRAAQFVLLVDFLKGLFPVLVAKIWLFPHQPILHVLVAVAIVVGHSRSVFLGFKGGKSAASGLGTMIGLSPVIGLMAAVIAVVAIKLSRIVSVGSMLAAVVTPILLFAFGEPFAYSIYGLLAAVYVIFLHRANILRLLQGTENKLE